MATFAKAAAPCWLLVMASAFAQPAKPDATAEAAAAMERARRQAAGPMRIILEASKARRKAGEAEPAVAAAPAVKSVAARTAAAAAAPAAAPATVVSEARPQLVSAAPNGDAGRVALRSEPLNTPPPAAPVEAEQTVQDGVKESSTGSAGVLSSNVLQSRPVSAPVPSLQGGTQLPVPGMSLVQPAALPTATPSSAMPAAATVASASTAAVEDRPRLLSMIEPDLTVRMLDQLGRNATVLVDLTLRADGSVASMALVGPASRQLERALAPTLEQWKFAPMASGRVHRVELVFNPDR